VTITTHLTGVKCRNGHIGERFISDKKCVDCVRERDRKRYLVRREEKRRYDREYYKLNKDVILENASEWQKNNRKRKNEICSDYYHRNPHKVASLTRSKKRQRPPWLSKDQRNEMAECYRLAKMLSKKIGVMHHVDHIIPLNGKVVSGLHVPWNLQVIPADVNLRKSNSL